MQANEIDVGPMVCVGVASGLLGGDVGRRAKRRPDRRQRGVLALAAGCGHGLGNPEIGHRGRTAREEDVVRLDVAVHNAVRMGVLQSPRDVAQDGHRLGQAHCAIAREAGPERLALDERHRVVRQAVGFARRQHGHDVWVLEARRDLDFAPETFGTDLCGELRRQHLYDDLAAERGFFGDEDLGHPAAAEFTLKRVGVAEGRLESVAQARHLAPVGRGTVALELLTNLPAQRRRSQPKRPPVPPRTDTNATFRQESLARWLHQ